MTLNDFLPFFHQYGYIIIFLGAFLESIIVVTLFLPGSIITLFGGYIAGQGNSMILPMFFFAFLGVFAGDTVNYLLGRSNWQHILRKTKFYSYFHKKEKPAYEYLKRFGFSIIIYSHLVYFRSVICFFAGSAKMSLRKYLSAIFISSLIWSSVFVFTGYFLGLQGYGIKDVNKKLSLLLGGLIVLVIIFKIIQSRLQFYLKKRLEKGNSKTK